MRALPQDAKEPTEGTGRLGFCLIPALAGVAWGQALASLSLIFLVCEMGAKIPGEHSSFKALRFDNLASNSNSPM